MNNTIGYQQGKTCILTDDAWELVTADTAVENLDSRILEWPCWLEQLEAGRLRPETSAVLLGPDEDPNVLAPWIDRLPLIALQFPRFMDGRAYSQASLLRTRLGYTGDIRAIGDVLRDQLLLMRHCGFTSFCVRADKRASDAIKGLSDFDQIYARSVASPEPLYRRRERV